jgi:excisionase family DNA binding protein
MIARETGRNSTGLERMATVAEAAKMLGVSPRRVLQFIEDGRLSAQRVTARLYVLDRAEVERFANTPREPGNPGQKKSKR